MKISGKSSDQELNYLNYRIDCIKRRIKDERELLSALIAKKVKREKFLNEEVLGRFLERT